MKIVELFTKKIVDNTISYEQVPNRLKDRVAEQLYRIDKTLIPEEQQARIATLQK